jgi:hypothetical protein
MWWRRLEFGAGQPGSCSKAAEWQAMTGESFRQFTSLNSMRAPLPACAGACGGRLWQLPPRPSPNKESRVVGLPHFPENPPIHSKKTLASRPLPSPSSLPLFSFASPPSSDKSLFEAHARREHLRSFALQHALGESPRTTTFPLGSWTRRRAAIEAPRLISAASYFVCRPPPGSFPFPFLRGGEAC